MIICSEDVSSDPNVAVQLHALYEMARVASKDFKGRIEKLQELQAVGVLCRAPKSRQYDHLGGVILERKKRGERLEIPEYAIDPHCARGKAIHGRWGSGTKEDEVARKMRWYDDWAKLDRADGQDRYEAACRFLETNPSCTLDDARGMPPELAECSARKEVST